MTGVILSMQRRIIGLFLLLPGLAGLSPVTAGERDVRFQRHTTEHGLSQNSVTCLWQDPDGFIWLGTQDGLNRFDGHRYEIFIHDPRNPDSLRDNTIRCLAGDADGFIWIGTQSGLDRYDPVTGEFQHMPVLPGGAGTTHPTITALIKDPSGMLWIGTGKGLDRFDTRTGRWDHFFSELGGRNATGGEFIRSLALDSSGNIWVGTWGNGLFLLNRNDGNSRQFMPDSGRNGGLLDTRINSIRIDGRGRVWIATPAGLSCLDPAKSQFTHYLCDQQQPPSIPYNLIQDLCVAPDGSIWAGSNGRGLFRLDPGSGQATRFPINPLDSRSLSYHTIMSLYIDNQQGLWIGTYGGGADRLDLSPKPFEVWRRDPGNPRQLTFSSIRAIYEDRQGTVWIGGYGGLLRFRPEPSGRDHFNKDSPAGSALTNNNVYCIAPAGDDPAGPLWIGTEGGGLNRIDPVTGRVDRQPLPGLPGTLINCIHRDRTGCFWFATNEGLYLYGPPGQKIRPMLAAGEKFLAGLELSGFQIKALAEDEQGIMWIGTSQSGLLAWDLKSACWLPADSYQPAARARLPRRILSLLPETGGGLYIGSPEGLYHLTAGRQLIRYTRLDGLPNEMIYAMLPDGRGGIWLSTNRGLSRFDSREKTFRNFEVEDGLSGNEFNSGAAWRNPRTGRIFFGGVDGITSFSPGGIQSHPYQPLPVITGLRIFNLPVKPGRHSLLTRPITKTGSLTISYKHNVIGFDFSALCYTPSNHYRYAYRLDDFDPDWNYLEAGQRSAVFTNLDPGTYRLRIKATNLDGAWSPRERVLQLVVVPPFWYTPWFKSLILLLVAGSVFAIHRWRFRQIRTRNDWLESQVTLRTSELQSKNAGLERVNEIVSTINASRNLPEMLGTLLLHLLAFPGVERAAALVLDKQTNRFRFVASQGWPEDALADIVLTPEEANSRFTQQTRQFAPDVFLIKEYQQRPGQEHFGLSATPGSELIIRIRLADFVTGYIILSNMSRAGAFDEPEFHILDNLQGHITSAFIKDQLLLELEQEQQATESANRAKGMFLARMSHEIRTPMNGILGFAELLMNTRLSPEQQEYVQTITRSGESLLILLNDILDFTRLESGKMTFQTTSFDPESNAWDICELMLSRIGSRPVEMIFHVDPRVPGQIQGDPLRFRQVLLNLLGNALKFTHAGEIELDIGLAAEEGSRIKLHIRVRDTGIGIRAGKLEDIFEAFSQADESTTRQYGGTGLGLAICREIAQQQDGSIWAESREGGGSVFHFTSWYERPLLSSGVRDDQSALEGCRLLVLEEHRRIRDILIQILQAGGAQVTAADTIEEVMTAWRQAAGGDQPFSACLLDVSARQDEVLAAVQQIRQLAGEERRVPLVACTATSARYSNEFGPPWFDLRLAKPYHRPVVWRLLRDLLHPRFFSEPPVAEPEPEPPESTIKNAAGIVLLAEDNHINQRLVQQMLRKEGIEVEIAANGRIAIDLIQLNPDRYLLVLMDLLMPELDGQEATRIIRRMGLQELPVIALTADTADHIRAGCLAAGMNDFLSKPFKIEDIRSILEKYQPRTKR